MIRATVTPGMLKRISVIEESRFRVANVKLPALAMNRLRKNSKKKSSYASNKIEGNPLTEQQADEAIERDPHRHFLKPEQEVRNYFTALSFLEDRLADDAPVTTDFVLQVQAIVEKGAPKEKIGLRGSMSPGVLFAVYDAQSGVPEYIPPDASEVPGLLAELERYIAETDDHPLIVAAIVHYQLVTIHPFEDGNGRTARLVSGYILDRGGYGFQGIGSLEEYFAYNPDEYYASLQMGLPPLYYDGRDNPPHPEVWIDYFLHMVELYSSKAAELADGEAEGEVEASLSHLSAREKELLAQLLREGIREFAPIDVARELGVTNRTIINRTTALVENGFIEPTLVRQRIRSYVLTSFSLANRDTILSCITSSFNLQASPTTCRAAWPSRPRVWKCHPTIR